MIIYNYNPADNKKRRLNVYNPTNLSLPSPPYSIYITGGETIGPDAKVYKGDNI